MTAIFQLGGNSNSWGIEINQAEVGLRLCPLDDVDFEQREWLPHSSGWPFDRNYLLPFYECAHKAFRLKDVTYTGKDWETVEAPQIPFKGDRVTTKIFQFGPRTAFNQDFKQTALYDLRQKNGVSVMGALGLTNEAIRREQVLNTAAWLFPRSKYFRPSKAVASLKALLSSQSQQADAQGVWHHLGTIATGLDDVAAFAYNKLTRKTFYPHLFAGGWSELEHPEQMYDVFEVLHTTEQAPHPDNRVILSPDIDKLGRRKAQMQTRWRDADMESIKRSQEIMAAEVARSGFGRYVIDRDGEMPVLERAGTAHHNRHDSYASRP